MSGRVVIVDFQMGNLNSIQKQLRRLGAQVEVSSAVDVVAHADKLVIPGVGHFQRAVESLQAKQLFAPIEQAVKAAQKPVLGICLGLQLMAKHSEEGRAQGFGFLEAEVVRFRVADSLRYKVPHMGWNQVRQAKSSALFAGINDASEFYFAHTFHLQSGSASLHSFEPAKPDSALQSGSASLHSFEPKSYDSALQMPQAPEVLAYTTYEKTFVSAIERGPLFGVQFHPEKSHDVGLTLLENFLKF
jgi:imidazole glycerol-phosphate synthase subunit HisH